MAHEQGNADEILLEVRNLKKYFSSSSSSFGKINRIIKAVDDVSFRLKKGEVLGLVGESGCGKTTLGRLILKVYAATDGKIIINLNGKPVDVLKLKGKTLRALREHMQMIFQDPYSSLNPRKTILDIVSEPIRVHGLLPKSELFDRVKHLMNIVGLETKYIRRYPHAFSGGQRQRIGIARALATNPQLIVCDEPVSALDVSVQAQIINLLQDLQQEFGITLIFISHGLSAVRKISDRVIVMYVGKFVEQAETDELYEHPAHPYTEALLSAAPSADLDVTKKRIVLEGEIADPAHVPSGCPFHPRCIYAEAICSTEVPLMTEIRPGHFCACHLADMLNLSGVE